MKKLVYGQSATPMRNGERIIVAQPLEPGTIAARFIVSRCTSKTPMFWENESTRIELRLEASYDNCATWVDGGSFSDTGGVRVVDGIEQAETVALFDYADNPTHICGKIIVSGGPAYTKCAVEVEF